MKRILVTAPGFEELTSMLEEAGEVVNMWGRLDRSFTEDELAEMTPNFDAVIVWIDPLGAKGIQAAGGRLRVIGVPRAGYDNVDVRAATELGIPVVYAPGMNAGAVADFTLGLLLSLSRAIPYVNMRLKTGGWRGRWAIHPGISLEGRVLGIIGLGNIGCRVAMRAQSFGMKVLAYDPYLSYDTMTALRLYPRELGVELVDLETLLKESDFITLHLPLRVETEALIGERELSLMKETAYLINTSRGGVVKQEALYKALAEGRIAGAALDVFEKEPIEPTDPLLKLDNLIATPPHSLVHPRGHKESQYSGCRPGDQGAEGQAPRYQVCSQP